MYVECSNLNGFENVLEATFDFSNLQNARMSPRTVVHLFEGVTERKQMSKAEFKISKKLFSSCILQ